MNFEPDCLHCGKTLEGRQRRTCSPRCRKAIQRKPPGLRTCKLCAQPFQPSGRGRPTTCPYDDADDYCQSLQDDQEDALAARAAAREAQTCQAPNCGAPAPYTGRGRPPLYCSRSCKGRAYRSAAS